MPLSLHLLFDLIAAALAFAATLGVWRWRLAAVMRPPDALGTGYHLALLAGAALGGYGLGTLNLWLTGVPGVGRSILGAFAGAVLAVELWKARTGLRGSTGAVFVAGFAVSVAVGRVGCFLSGLDDQTHGVPTTLPWGHDFGDGIPRHPVQLYESAAMLAFLAVFVVALARRAPWVPGRAFYWLALVYAGQRFLWEFLKPYATVLGPLNLFHLACLGLIGYAVVMLRRGPDGRA